MARADRAAIGLKAHSRWAVLVAVAGPAAAPRIVLRERLMTAAADDPSARFPYHAAEQADGRTASEIVARHTADAHRCAEHALGGALLPLRAAHVIVDGALLCGAPCRPLPDLAGILASHALIHTAEGVLFRTVLEAAARHHDLPLRRVSERDLLADAAVALELAPAALASWAAEGRALGAPWTREHQLAAVAARLVLAGRPAR